MFNKVYASLVIITLGLSTYAQAEKSEQFPSITVHGQVQLQFDSGQLKATTGDDPAFNGIKDLPAHNRLDLRRTRLSTTLHLSDDTEIYNQTDYNTRSNQPTVLDLYLRQRLDEKIYMKAGMFKIPFGHEAQRSSKTTNTIEISDVTRAISQVRDSGLAFNGQTEGLDWAIGIFQGQGNVWSDRDNSKNIIAQVGYKIVPEVDLGISLQYGSYNSLPVRRWGLDLQYAEGPFKVEAEALWSNGYNLISKGDTRAFGFYTALVYQVAENHDLVLHFDQFDPDLELAQPGLTGNSSNRRNRLLLGYNYYLQRSPEHRIMFNYEIPHEEEGPAINNSGLRVRYQYAW